MRITVHCLTNSNYEICLRNGLDNEKIDGKKVAAGSCHNSNMP